MQVVKIVVCFALAVAVLLLASCYGNRVTAEEARNVNPEDYGGIEMDTVHDGYHLEDFMAACGALVMFQDDGANIVGECGGWQIRIETYQVESGLADPYWCTQVLLEKEGNGSSFAFGHIEGAMPRVVSQPERTLVRSAGAHPMRQRLEKATLEDLIELMTSGNLLEKLDDPLKGLSFSYLETDIVSGKATIHRPDGSETPMKGADTADEAQN